MNEGSKVVVAAAGPKRRELRTELPEGFGLPEGFSEARFCMEGVVAVRAKGAAGVDEFCERMQGVNCGGLALILLVDDSEFAARTLNNWLWVTFTRSNPSHDVEGIGRFTEHKHWGCAGPLVIDARRKPHHAPPLIEDPEVTKRVDALVAKGGPLHGILRE